MNTPLPRGVLLLVEDDAAFANVLARTLAARGFEVAHAAGTAAALACAHLKRPGYAVIDLKLGTDNGLDLIPKLRTAAPGIRMLLLTGYASVATAVEAIKRGAHDYLAKPVDTDMVVRALLNTNVSGSGTNAPVTIPDTPMHLARLEWEYIQRTLKECGGNISETARRLGMHRRTLQRKLDKHPVHERPKAP